MCGTWPVAAASACAAAEEGDEADEVEETTAEDEAVLAPAADKERGAYAERGFPTPAPAALLLPLL
jgi:hypothetical protein